jgi:hypothetical protein
VPSAIQQFLNLRLKTPKMGRGLGSCPRMGMRAALALIALLCGKRRQSPWGFPTPILSGTPHSDHKMILPDDVVDLIKKWSQSEWSLYCFMAVAYPPFICSFWRLFPL